MTRGAEPQRNVETDDTNDDSRKCIVITLLDESRQFSGEAGFTTVMVIP
jgi:hypothetical protein